VVRLRDFGIPPQFRLPKDYTVWVNLTGRRIIFSKSGVAEILNLQPRGSLAKPYQVKQVRSVIVRYKLAEGAE
jgi:hypothetical protein